ncbi:D-hexose-6-phosphate mutarotase [Ectopseudomonas oleovorans]|jgi:glucose-6-phosphate 1-epimerase|uniref:Putative glucose-6-phosphate 1-epimerase n=2 Tax=Ectopseudomonas oleovorans TaxID=301 RepID=A0A061CN59_ECTOL|nr:D-hexose-6-phosphate mutarotase [Pseudomonas oleovorans]KFJ90513.1 aldose epimerase [Pseudomonas sp. 1-7]MBP8884866.1 D-hexose-6-phosphate mutarotase [Pseudomonas sp.]MBN7118891.1 aldose epimerase [Pseudomonas oleovorans]MBN7133940.1 aldose epimerase [Pseudomonas oleovorans]MBN7139331.1 aldose epimerase [Pseudomonas oleovorans]
MSTAQVERVELDQLVCWRIRAAGSELLVAQQGAQILSYQQGEQPPLIWLSPDAAYQRGQSVRGGVPVCWPWFGDLRRNPQAVQAHYHLEQAPAHGLVRALDWELLGIDEGGDAVTLRFAYDTRTQPLEGWPRDVGLTFVVRLADDLGMSLETHNRGTEPLTLSQALHSYFAVSDVRQVSVEGLQGCRYIDTLQDWQELRQQEALVFDAETDRIYFDTAARLSIVDPGWGRRIHLDARGSRSAVLWNPWVDKAKRLSQFPDDAWQNMLCIETANVLEDVVQLNAGERHRLELRLSSELIG